MPSNLNLSRKRFLKQAGIWVPALFFAPRVLASKPHPAFVAGLNQNPAVAASCDAFFTQTTADAAHDLGQNAHNSRCGCKYTPGSNINVCKVQWKLSKALGTISGLTYVTGIYTLSGTSLNTLLGESAGVSGSDSWSSTAVDFTFASSVSLSSGTTYGICVYRNDSTADSSNYANFRYHSSTLDTEADYTQWKLDKTQTGTYGTLSPYVIIYSQ